MELNLESVRRQLLDFLESPLYQQFKIYQSEQVKAGIEVLRKPIDKMDEALPHEYNKGLMDGIEKDLFQEMKSLLKPEKKEPTDETKP